MTDMTVELMVADQVGSWARSIRQDDDMAGSAIAVAIQALVGGASAAEACEEGRALAQSWHHHPAHRRDERSTTRDPAT